MEIKKYLDANEAYEILDNLFAKIQKKNYHVTQKMLDDTWNKWIQQKNAFVIPELLEKLHNESQDINGISMIPYDKVSELIQDEMQHGGNRICVDCGRTEKETDVMYLTVNEESCYFKRRI